MRALLAFPLLCLALPLSAQPLVIVVTEADCRALVRHVPDPDVAYTPGRDVAGRRVAPADLPGTPRIEIPRSFTIALEVDLRERLGIAGGGPGVEARADMGRIIVRDGAAFYGGARLGLDEHEAIREQCEIVYRRR